MGNRSVLPQAGKGQLTTDLKWLIVYISKPPMSVRKISGLGGEGASAPSKVLICQKFLKIRAKSMKMYAKHLNLGKLRYLKIQAKMASKVVYFWKMGAQRVEHHMKTFFFDVIPKEGIHDLCGKKYSHKVARKFFG